MLSLIVLLICLTIGQVWCSTECSANWDWVVEEAQTFSLRTCDGKLGPFAGHVPGSVHTDLIQANAIPNDPYYRYLEKNLSWIVEQCWEYSTDQEFTLSQYQAGCDLHLRLKGVDAVSTIYLNDNIIGHTHNAHREHDVIIPASLITGGGLKLKIRLQSALQYAKQQASEYPYVVPATENYNVWAEPTSRNFLRKAGSDFGWDWGPAFVNTGIGGGLSFYQRPHSKLDGMVIEQTLASDFSSAEVKVKAAIRFTNVNQVVGGSSVSVKVWLDDNQVVESTVIVPSTCQPGASCIVDIGTFTIQQPKLWWPRGYGDAYLYGVKIEVGGETLSKQIGLRTVSLVQDSIPTSTGTNNKEVTFYLRINGQNMFMRGANFIPIDSFHSRVSHTDRSFIFHSAAEANMNMLRVWGGGIYQPDDFYELADKFGIMIWQEVMLACALFPVDDAFLGEVEKEVAQQAVRLNTHPSIVVWGGNNENEVALYWFQPSQTNRDLYVSDYSKLYGGRVYPVLSKVLGKSTLANNVVWVDSSPSNGLVSVDPYVKLWGQASTAAQGDVHFYDYNCDCEDYRSFPEAKFISEFGFQTMPSFETYEPVILPEDYDVNSPLLQYRQRHQDGNSQIEAQMVKHFDLPTSCSGSDGQQRSFDMYLYLTMLQQSRCYETAMNRWRQLRGIDSDDNKYTMGILYWQLNDIWQGPSWASMEYSGRWKPLQYAVKRIFNMISLSFSYVKTTTKMSNGEATGSMEVYVVNDFLDRDVVYDVLVELKQWGSGASVATLFKDSVLVKSGKSTLISSKQLDATLLASYKCDFSSCYAKATATVSSTSQGKVDEDYQVLVATQPLTIMKESALPKDTNIQFLNFQQVSKHEVSFDITVNATSPFLFLEYTNGVKEVSQASTGVFKQYAGWFSNNNFLAEPGITYHLTYTSFVQEMTVDTLQKHMQGRAMQHVYNCQLPIFKP